jgi:alanyl-tRNA synthetase
MTEQHSRTQRLYLQDSYTVSFHALLISCEKRPEGGYVAVLDKTHFYPESGGQLADRGTINGVEVTDVWEDEAETVCHGLAGELMPGAADCNADWERRFDHMQQHTGQHVLSRAFIDIAGLNTIAFHMGDDACTIDLDGSTVDHAVLREAEDMANAIVCENREVAVRMVPRSEMDDAGLRKSLPEGVTDVRLVEVAGFDVCGCCGTHVRRTGELGVIKVLKQEKTKGATRVYFKVGRRAMMDYKQKHDVLSQLANRFTTAVDGVADKVEKMVAEGDQRRKELKKLQSKLVEHEVRELVASARIHNDRRFVVDVSGDRSDDFVKMLASALKSAAGTVGLLGNPGGRVVCVASKDVPIDFALPVVERAKTLGGSGGGKGGFASVQLPAEVDVAEFVEKVFEDVKNT